MPSDSFDSVAGSSAAGVPPGVPHLSDRVLSGADLTTVMHQLTCAARQMVPTAAGAGITWFDEHGTGHTLASTGTAGTTGHAAGAEPGRGPCVSAWTTGRTQRIDDTRTDPRWARWQATATEAGIHSVLSTPLVRLDCRLGVLTVYATTPGAFGAPEERVLGLLAGVAATLLGAAPLTDAPPVDAPPVDAPPVDAPAPRTTPWEETVDPYELTGLAVGVLMAREHLSPGAARAVLAEATSAQGRGLAEAATAVVDAALGSEQADRLQATMTAASINRQELWMRHFGLGGNVQELEIDAYIHHALLLPPFQRDELAHAVNDIVEDIAPPRASYTFEALAGLTSSPRAGGRDEEVSPAAETEEKHNDDPEAPGPRPDTT